MESLISLPSKQILRQYRRLRAHLQQLNKELVGQIPRQAIMDVAARLGIRRGDTLVFDHADQSSVLMDCCLFDWINGGLNLVQRYHGQHPAVVGTLDADARDAQLAAEFHILVVGEPVRGLGVQVEDYLTRQPQFLIDEGFSRTVAARPDLCLASRIMPAYGHSMTTGAALPMSPEAVEAMVARMAAEGKLLNPDRTPRNPHSFALAVVRHALRTGAMDHVRYA